MKNILTTCCIPYFLFLGDKNKVAKEEIGNRREDEGKDFFWKIILQIALGVF
jgi:hypothetical protein